MSACRNATFLSLCLLSLIHKDDSSRISNAAAPHLAAPRASIGEKHAAPTPVRQPRLDYVRILSDSVM